MSRKVLLVLLLWSAIVPARASGERKGGPGFVDDFRTLDNLRADATENVSQLRVLAVSLHESIGGVW